MKARLLLKLLAIPYLIFAIYSYTQTDPNLVLSQNSTYWSFQQQMWSIGYHQRLISTVIYIFLTVLMFLSYVLVQKKTFVQKIKYLAMIALLLLISYPALSHDIFNYMFNAKMVVVYHMNPHIHTALEFGNDLWTRFMHNTHTAAPYGYGWTILSIAPFLFGLQKFVLTLMSFKLWMYIGFFLLIWFQYKLSIVLKYKEWKDNIWLFVLNPLVLLETMSTLHNDVWMMLFAYISILFLWKSKMLKHSRILNLCISFIFLFVSISLKFATVSLLPAFLILAFPVKKIEAVRFIIEKHWADHFSILLFVPLFLNKSQQFHPWYLIWSLSMIPFMKSTFIKKLFIAFSFSSLLRYVPYLFQGDYSGSVSLHEKVITWVLGFIFFGILVLFSRFVQTKKPSHAKMIS